MIYATLSAMVEVNVVKWKLFIFFLVSFFPVLRRISLPGNSTLAKYFAYVDGVTF